MLKQVPTCGRVVWYWSFGKAGDVEYRKHPAIVHDGYEVDGDIRADLTVLSPYISSYQTQVSQCGADDPRPGCWSWMPYQEQKAQTAQGNESESAEANA